MSMAMAVGMLVIAMLVVMVVTIVVVMIAVMMVIMVMIMMGMIMRGMVMAGVGMNRAFRMGMAAAGIGAAFGIERRLDLDHPRAETFHHFLDDVIAPDAQRFR